MNRSPRPIPASPQTVAVIASGFLGDMLLLQPVLRALKSQASPPRLALIGSSAAQRLHAGGDYFDEILPLADAKSRRLEIAADLALVPYWHRTSAASLWNALDAAGAPPWITFDHDTGFARQYISSAADRMVRKDHRLHELENLTRLFQWAGLHSAPLPYDMAHMQDDPASVAKVPDGAIVLQPGSAQGQKVWSWGAWAEVAATLRRKTGRPVVAVGSAQELAALRDWRHRFALDVMLWPEIASPSLADLFTLFRRVPLLITTCSGPKHLAMAVDCPTLTLHGQSDERRWGDWFGTGSHRTLRALPNDLTPSEQAGWAKNEKMLAITPAAVITAAIKMLDTSHLNKGCRDSA